MAQYVYPAVFTEENGLYSVDFPDIPGCYTCGESLAHAIHMAEDVLAFTMYDYEAEGKEAPEASDIKTMQIDEGAFATLIVGDTLEYQKRNNNRAVKKTLTIPEWLNEAAVKAELNFSQVLQEALKERLDVTA